MDQHELDAELDRVRERARRRYWPRWFASFAPLYIAGMLLVGVGDRPNDESLVGRAITLVVTLAVAAGLLWLAVRRQWRWLPDPPVTAGLTRQHRRTVSRDLRRGTPNADPLLREVENRYVARYQRSGRWTVWLWPVLVIGYAAFAVLADSVVYRVIAIVTALMFVVAAVYQVVLNRGMRAFV